MRKVKDHFFKKAKAEGYAARSVYKLQELDRKFSLIKKSNTVLDLGCAPGSWLQFAAERAGKGGGVIGVDMTPLTIAIPSNAIFIRRDARKVNGDTLLSRFGEFDVVLSDMAPRTTGIKLTDQTASLELAELAYRIALRVLKTGGHFMCKIFESPEVSRFKKKLQQGFKTVRLARPRASRSGSFEMFLIAMGMKRR